MDPDSSCDTQPHHINQMDGDNMLKKTISALLLSTALLISGCQIQAEGQPGSQTVTSGRTGAATSEKTTVSEKSGTKSGTTASTAPAETTEAEDTAFTLVVSGDVLSHITNTEAARQADGSYDFMPQLGELKDLLSAGDVTLVNLESIVAGKEFGYSGFPRFNAPVNLAQTIKKLGVDVVATANNHAVDKGIKGLNANLNNLEKIGLDATGTYRSQEEADQAYVRDINGIKVGFVASTYGTNNIPVPNDYAVNFNSHDQIRAEIAEARDQGAELIVYHIHWGREYTEYPSQKQMDTYRVLTEEGVDIIVGSHPHRLQPMEIREIEYEGRTKQQAVIWSTGNLWQGQVKNKDYINLGSIFRVDVRRRNGEIEVAGLDYDLIYNLRWKVDGKENYKVIPREDMDLYKADFPKQYETMKKEFQWGDNTLKKSVEVIYSDGTRAD